jgi:hypothetical protein
LCVSAAESNRQHASVPVCGGAHSIRQCQRHECSSLAMCA